jgi:hypothetical protein
VCLCRCVESIDNPRVDEVLRKLLEQETNNECFDCHKRHPAWASLNNAVFLCIDCCGKHRSAFVVAERFHGIVERLLMLISRNC